VDIRRCIGDGSHVNLHSTDLPGLPDTICVVLNKVHEFAELVAPHRAAIEAFTTEWCLFLCDGSLPEFLAMASSRLYLIRLSTEDTPGVSTGVPTGVTVGAEAWNAEARNAEAWNFNTFANIGEVIDYMQELVAMGVAYRVWVDDWCAWNANKMHGGQMRAPALPMIDDAWSRTEIALMSEVAWAAAMRPDVDWANRNTIRNFSRATIRAIHAKIEAALHMRPTAVSRSSPGELSPLVRTSVREDITRRKASAIVDKSSAIVDKSSAIVDKSPPAIPAESGKAAAETWGGWFAAAPGRVARWARRMSRRN
jgi:hypothetical protein